MARIESEITSSMNGNGLKVVAVETPDRYLRSLRDGGVQVLAWNPGDPIDDFVRAARILLYWAKDRTHAEPLVESMESLEWVHVPWAGVERLMHGPIAKGQVALTNSAKASGIPVAEYVLAAILSISKRFGSFFEAQSRGEWVTTSSTREVLGSRLLMIGFGDIGKRVAMLARAVGMVVDVVATRARCEEGVNVRALNELPELLPNADYIVLAVPSTEHTRPLMTAERIACIKNPECWIINVGRGECIDDEALIEAVRGRRIGGAWLDVVSREPLPPDSNLWGVPSIVITPHVSSWTDQRFDRSFQIFLDNLDRYRSGKPLVNVVNERAVAGAQTPSLYLLLNPNGIP